MKTKNIYNIIATPIALVVFSVLSVGNVSADHVNGKTFYMSQSSCKLHSAALRDMSRRCRNIYGGHFLINNYPRDECGFDYDAGRYRFKYHKAYCVREVH